MQCSLNDTALSSILPPVLIAEFILGTLGNGFALWIFCFHLRPWRSSTVLLFSLVVADCLLLVALPFRVSYYHNGFEWRFGNTFCTICHFLVASNRAGSVVFLIAIALDRYVRVLHPHHPLNFLSVSKAACGAAVLWLGTVSLSLFVTLNKTNSGYCGSFSHQSSRNYNVSPHRLGFLLGFYASFLVILFSTVCIVKHLRKRQIARHAEVKKAQSVMIAIVVLFAVCFLPSNITQLVIWFKARDAADAVRFCAEMQQLTVVYYVAVSLTYLNSALDPVVYYFSSSEFRRPFFSTSQSFLMGLRSGLCENEPPT
uniref:G-protein coupled receptors family 1 profile domain-containing protein n=1 Tax=Neogobius melanostomus TaxID=47308 RepID=A0A8C6SLF1_9GOBI